MSLAIKNLENILLQEFTYSIDPLPKLQSEDIKKTDLADLVKTTYDALGGIGEKAPTFTSDWHLELEGLAVQWDDELHFNKYRRVTLRSKAYDTLKVVNKMKYLDHCRKREKECLKAGLAGKKWHHHHAEKAFGISEEPGDLGGKGSAAWRYRAWGDFLQDITALIYPIKVLRLSIWDELLINKKLVKLGELITNPSEEQQEIILQHLKRRIALL